MEPAQRQAAIARNRGVRTLEGFFDGDMAERIIAELGKARLFLANNVLAHAPDLCGFVEAIRLVLAPEGMAVIEVRYVKNLVDRCEFDTISHQHLCYFCLSNLCSLFQRFGCEIIKAERVGFKGGTLRIYVMHAPRIVGSSVITMLETELRSGVLTDGMYFGFEGRVRLVVKKLQGLLAGLGLAGKQVAGYGAAGKACTLMSVAGIDEHVLEYMVDVNPMKQGLFMPGAEVEILSPIKLLVDRPDFVLLFAWDFVDEVLAVQRRFFEAGGRAIVAIPEVVLI